MSQLSRNKDIVLPYGRHYIDEEDIRSVTEVLKSNWLTTGPAVEKFETKLCDVTGANYAVACSSGTAALHLLCLSLGIGVGDAVIVPAITFLATANAVRFTGADVIFADVDHRTGLITPEALDKTLDQNFSSNIKAVFAVHMNGQTAPIEKLDKIIHNSDMYLLEDGCHALGTSYSSFDNKRHFVGGCASGLATCFSFHPVKTIAAGEGGAVTTNDKKLADRMRQYRNHGMVKDKDRFVNNANALDSEGKQFPWYYEMQMLGFNYRLSDIHAALGLSQLEKLTNFSKKRRYLMKLYDEKLSLLLPHVASIDRVKNCDPVLHLYPVIIDFKYIGKSREKVMEELSKYGILTQVHYLPVNRQPYYTSLYGDVELEGADEYYQKILSLPFYTSMTEDDVNYVVCKLKKVVGL